MLILGLSGRAGSGKSLVASMLVSSHHAYDAQGARSVKVRQPPLTDYATTLCRGVEIAFADPVKHAARDLFGFSDEVLWGPSEARNAPDLRYPRYRPHDAIITPEGLYCRRCRRLDVSPVEATCVDYLTAREALQKIGTEVARECYPDVWIDIALRKAKMMSSAKLREPVVISDVRFLNEAQAIQTAGGQVWHIERQGAKALSSEAAGHASERGFDEIRKVANVTINNDRTLEDLWHTLVPHAETSGYTYWKHPDWKGPPQTPFALWLEHKSK